MALELTKQEAERRADLKELRRIAKRLAKVDEMQRALYDARRSIWERRLTAGDTTKADLARESDVTFMAVTAGVARKFTGRKG